jgi:DNA-binding transcriptional ArsR family regulator
MNSRYRADGTPQQCASVPQLCSLLGGGVRIELLRALSLRRQTVSDLADLLELSQPQISHDLGELRRRAMVMVERQGLYRWYSIADAMRSCVDQGRLTLHFGTADGDELIVRTRIAIR